MQLISVQVISCAGNLPSVQLISVQVISRAGNCMQVIGSSKSDSGNFHAVKLSLPIKIMYFWEQITISGANYYFFGSPVLNARPVLTYVNLIEIMYFWEQITIFWVTCTNFRATCSNLC